MRRIAVLALLLPAGLALAAPAVESAIPGRNGNIVVDRPNGFQGDLYALTPGGQFRRLSVTRYLEADAAWGPGGNLIAFSRENPPTNRGLRGTELWAADGRGKGQRRLTSFRRDTGEPSWAPDGSKIAFVTNRDSPRVRPGLFSPGEVYTINLDGTGLTRLTANTLDSDDPSFSPDGTRIVYSEGRRVSNKRVDRTLFVMNADGSGQRQITPSGGALELNPNWSPDGTRIVFDVARQDGRNVDIGVVNPDGTGMARIVTGPRFENNPAYSPDGRFIVFISDRHARRRNGGRNSDSSEIYVMNADGTGVRRITRNRVPDRFPDWQPLP